MTLEDSPKILKKISDSFLSFKDKSKKSNRWKTNENVKYINFLK